MNATSNTFTDFPALSPLFSTAASLSEACIRDIVREEIRAALDEDAARRAVLADYDRLTAEWRRKHGGRP